MSSDTPPSIPPRKASGSAAGDKPAGRTATDTAGRGASPKAAGGSGSPATKATPTTKGSAPAKGGTPAAKPAGGATSGAASANGQAPARTSATPAATATQEAARPSSGATAARTGTAAAGTGAGTATTTAPGSSSATTRDAGTSTAARPATSGSITGGSGPRRVRLAVSRVDPWSVMKLSFLISVAVGIMIVVATAVVWLTLDSLHVFATINDLVTEILADSDFDIMTYVEFDRVLSVATLVAVVDIFLITALATIGAFLYNITAALVGGVHVTMTDE